MMTVFYHGSIIESWKFRKDLQDGEVLHFTVDGWLTAAARFRQFIWRSMMFWMLRYHDPTSSQATRSDKTVAHGAKEENVIPILIPIFFRSSASLLAEEEGLKNI